jgi:hypothetical protein
MQVNVIPVLPTEIWDEIILNYLTPKSIGRLECTCKSMKNAIKHNKAWENQAVLAWNGFYREYEEYDEEGERVYHNHVLQFIPILSSEYRTDVKRYITEFSREKAWLDWKGILCKLEVVGDDHSTLGYATTDPKVVTYNEILLRKNTISTRTGRGNG